MRNFPVRVKGKDVLRHIFPAKQADVQRIIEKAENIPEASRVIVFGSAVTWDFGMFSDLDIAIEHNGAEDFSALASQFRKLKIEKLDIIDGSDVRNELLKSEINNGVAVYDKFNQIS